MTALIIGLCVVALVVVIALASQRSGPRVTQITRTVHKEKDEDDA
jgi:multisubunit Na+/H+ antiporter MnhC subunit